MFIEYVYLYSNNNVIKRTYKHMYDNNFTPSTMQHFILVIKSIFKITA